MSGPGLCGVGPSGVVQYRAWQCGEVQRSQRLLNGMTSSVGSQLASGLRQKSTLISYPVFRLLHQEVEGRLGGTALYEGYGQAEAYPEASGEVPGAHDVPQQQAARAGEKRVGWGGAGWGRVVWGGVE